jgi:hypothetical protein
LGLMEATSHLAMERGIVHPHALFGSICDTAGSGGRSGAR